MATTVFKQEDVVMRANLKATPEYAVTREGKPMATFSLAENKRVRNEETGEWEDAAPAADWNAGPSV